LKPGQEKFGSTHQQKKKQEDLLDLITALLNLS